MKKLLFLFLSILLSFCSIEQTFALNYKNNFPSNFYTKETVPDVNNPLNYCTPWPWYDPQYLKLEYKFSGRYMDFDCYWDNWNEKLQAKGGWIMLKEESVTPPPPPKIPGCTNPQAPNYNPQATEDNGTCQEKIEWCTDSTAINYNPLANVHKESLCEYPPPYTPQDITASFEKSQVSIGATTWTLRFTLNVADASLDFNNIQTWNKFKAISATTNDKTITLTLRQFDDQRLDVECTNYEVTIPRRAIVTPQGDTNPNPISGNFEVVGCQNFNTDPQDPNSQNEDKNNQPKHENTIKEDNFYLSLYDTDEKWKVYLNLTNVIYILGFISFFLVLFFVLFWFIKNSFLWKKSSR